MSFTFILTLISEKQDLDDPSVTPPTPILEHAQILREIAMVYQSSLLGDDPAPTPVDHHQPTSEVPETNEGAVGFQHILDVMVDPAVQMCETAVEEKHRLRALTNGIGSALR